jgi:predicted nucleic acid-binding protein
MIGLDTNILVAYVIPEHPAHGKVRECIDQFRLEGRRLALTSGILAEFVHVVTDSKRFENPLSMTEALEWAAFWSDAVEVALISTEIAAHRLWLDWLVQHRLGRKRLLDTLIAAVWWSAGIREVFTLNPADFRIFDAFTLHTVN